jgi:hypothetical protein
VVPVTGLPGGFSGNFAPGEKLLFGAPDLVLLFNSPISGVGMQIQPPIFNVAFCPDFDGQVGRLRTGYPVRRRATGSSGVVDFFLVMA